MSVLNRLPRRSTLLIATIILLATSTSSPRLRSTLHSLRSAPTSPSRFRLLLLLALALGLVNFKNLPGSWHFRVLRGFFYQVHLQASPPVPPRHLFAPLVTATYNTPYDCDYNGHKSNSTYFADFDVARAHFMGALLRVGLGRLHAGDEDGLPPDVRAAPGKYTVALGAVTAFFHREIAPLQRFDVVTRLLAWDRKWLYAVSHVVRPGACQPSAYVLQPRRGAARSRAAAPDPLAPHHIFATSVARYVFKKGRRTISPELVLERSHLLPSRPPDTPLPPRAEAVPASQLDSLSTTDSTPSPPDTAADPASEAPWTWSTMERERLRGLHVAQHLDGLGSGAQSALRVDEAWGRYGDYF